MKNYSVLHDGWYDFYDTLTSAMQEACSSAYETGVSSYVLDDKHMLICEFLRRDDTMFITMFKDTYDAMLEDFRNMIDRAFLYLV